ncbi:MAG: BA14K family protein [Rhizobiaceae bacterium]|nr:BA14K family protein [Rhizobiaceae bacterium]
MGKAVKSIIITLAITASTLVPLSQAQSKDWGNRQYGNNARSHGGFEQGRQRHERSSRNDRHYGPKHGPKPGRRHYPAARSNNNDDALLLGILGLAAGAVIGGALLSEPSYNRPPRRSYAPNAVPNYYPPAPAPAYAQGGDLEPWSDNWYRYCAQKYRSFKAATGTYRGYDGKDHFCVAR